MAVLPAGDKTTQLRIWLNANAAGSDIMPKSKAALVTATALPATLDMTVLMQKFVDQR